MHLKVAATVAGIALVFVPLAARQAPSASVSPRLLAVPLVSQARPWTCGAAALMATLLYFGVFDDTESRLDEELGVNPEQGTRVVSIVSEARRFGLAAEARTGLTLADLDRELARGSVVIVALQAWAVDPVADWQTHWEDGHYVVVVGISGERVYVMDPSVRTGYGYLQRQQFLERWHDYDLEDDRSVVYDRLGIVIRGAGRLARYPAEPIPVE
jgi:ABC-type bacteriocin/lantibiotic exporter with double-glycine peptidase domain